MPECIQALRDEMGDLAQLIEATQHRIAGEGNTVAWEISLEGLQERQERLRAELAEELDRAQIAEVMLAFDGEPVMDGTLDLGFLSRFLGGFQKVVSSVGQAIVAEPTSRGAIPENIMGKTALRLAAVAPGSFEVRLVGGTQPNLLGESLIEEALDRLHGLLAAGDNAARLADSVAQLGPRVQSHYAGLLEVLAGNSAGVTVRSVVSRESRPTVNVTSAQAREARAALGLLKTEDERVEPLWGRLIGLRQHRQDFEFHDALNDDIITGKVTADALGAAVENYNKEIVGTFAVERLTVSGTDEVRETYTLLRIQSQRPPDELYAATSHSVASK